MARANMASANMASAARKALICGVTGQDGSLLAKHLLSQGYAVHGTTRDAQACQLINLQRLGCDQELTLHSMAPHDFRSVFGVLHAVKPQEVYYLAGQSSVGLSFEQPVEAFESIQAGILNVLEAIRIVDPGMRLFHAGSSDCFGSTDAGPADEHTPFRPRSPYGVAKSAATWTVSNYRDSYGLFACTGILFNHESPQRSERFVTAKIVHQARRIAQGQQSVMLLGNTKLVRDWGWAEEYVAAMALMLKRDEPEDFVLGTGESISLQAFLETVFEAFGLDVAKHVRQDPSLSRPLDIAVSRCNPAKAQQLLGWRASTGPKAVAHRLCGTMVQTSMSAPKALHA